MILPTTELQLPLLRAAFSGANALFGTHAPAISVGPTFLGGYYTQPFRVPEDYDRTRPGHLYAFLTNGLAVGPAAGDVVINAGRTTADVAASALSVNADTTFPIPATWPSFAWQQVELLDPAGSGAPFFPANSLGQLGLAGIRLLRNGPAVADTWTGTLLLLATVLVRYHRLCLHCTTC